MGPMEGISSDFLELQPLAFEHAEIDGEINVERGEMEVNDVERVEDDVDKIIINEEEVEVDAGKAEFYADKVEDDAEKVVINGEDVEVDAEKVEVDADEIVTNGEEAEVGEEVGEFRYGEQATSKKNVRRRRKRVGKLRFCHKKSVRPSRAKCGFYHRRLSEDMKNFLDGFLTQVEPNEHSRRGKGTFLPTLRCDKCAFNVPSRRPMAFLAHYNNTHKDRFECADCASTHPSKRILGQHLKEVHGNGISQVVILRSNDDDGKDVHAVVENGALDNDNCPSNIVQKESRVEWPCKICGKNFRFESRLKSHTMSHSTVRPYCCIKCPATFKYATVLKTHATFYCKGSTRLNVEDSGRIGTDVKNCKNSSSQPKPAYCCKACGSTFKRMRMLKWHGGRCKMKEATLKTEPLAKGMEEGLKIQEGSEVHQQAEIQQELEVREESQFKQLTELGKSNESTQQAQEIEMQPELGNDVGVCPSIEVQSAAEAWQKSGDVKEKAQESELQAELEVQEKTETGEDLTAGRSAGNGGVYACDICGQSFFTESSLNIHKMTHVKMGCHVCDICCKTFAHRDSLKHHKEFTHSSLRRFYCITCGSSFKRLYSLQRHAKKMNCNRKDMKTESVMMETGGKGETMDGANDLEVPRMIQVQESDPFGHDEFSTQYEVLQQLPALEIQQEDVRRILESEPQMDAPLEMLRVMDVHEAIEARMILEMRQELESRLALEMETGMEAEPDVEAEMALETQQAIEGILEIKMDTEETRSLDFQTKTSSKAAKRRRRGRWVERIHDCDVCGKSFLSDSNLKGHKLIHVGTRKHVCNVCGKRFIRAGHLNEHVKIHSGNTVSCPVCGGSFSRHRSMLKHLKSVHGMMEAMTAPPTGRPGAGRHVCGICGKCFLRSRSLSNHRLIHENKRSFRCDFCAASYNVKGSLQRHVRDTHRNEREAAAAAAAAVTVKEEMTENGSQEGWDRVRHLGQINVDAAVQCNSLFSSA